MEKTVGSLGLTTFVELTFEFNHMKIYASMIKSTAVYVDLKWTKVLDIIFLCYEDNNNRRYFTNYCDLDIWIGLYEKSMRL